MAILYNPPNNPFMSARLGKVLYLVILVPETRNVSSPPAENVGDPTGALQRPVITVTY